MEAWEWQAMVEWARSSDGDPGRSWKTLIVEGFALQSRTMADVERYLGPGAPESQRAAAGADLETDAVLAFQMLGELQRNIERMVVRGQMEQAKRLTQFRRRLNECTAAVGRLLGDDVVREAEGTAAGSPEAISIAEAQRSSVLDSPSPALEDARLKALLTLEDQLQKRAESDANRPTPAAPLPVDPLEAPARRSRVGALLVVLAVAATAWIVLVLWARAGAGGAIPVLSAQDFEGIPGVRHVVARPPSLFVTVDEVMWRGMEPEARRQLIERIGSKAAEAGYRGVQVTGPGGTVGSWLRTTGVWLASPSRSSS